MSRREWEAEYREQLNEHISHVREAGKLIGASPDLLAVHDASKFSKEEFGAYARRFCGPHNDDYGIKMAWMHHIHNNPHHWQHWIFPDTGEALVMPLRYCLEMVADWMGSSLTYTDSFDMTPWLKGNLRDIMKRCHPQTKKRVCSILDSNGYDPIYERLYDWGVIS